MFDKGRSARAAVLAMNGDRARSGARWRPRLPAARATSIEPGEMAFALEWVIGLLANEGVDRSRPRSRTRSGRPCRAWHRRRSRAHADRPRRAGPVHALSQALAPYTLEGPYGRLLDGATETLALADVMHFEMDGLMQHKGLVLPVLTYLFHRLEARFDGRPTLLVLDEAWMFLDDPLFAARIREWLKTLRKKNVAVVFATQSLADIERSSIAPAIIESCPTRIFLPNDRAIEPQMRTVYERFGLNARQIEIIARATPKRDYYAQTARGNRLFELGLGPIALAFAAPSSPDDQRLIDRMPRRNPAGFAAAFLRAKGLPGRPT